MINLNKKDKLLWDELANGYDSLIVNTREKNNWYKEDLIPKIQKLTTLKSSVLDFGCGNGYLAQMLQNTGYKVTGIDVSNKMIDIAKAAYPNLNLLSGDIAKLRLKNKKFDSIIANMVFHDIGNLNGIIKKLDQLLKTNGHIIFSIPHPCFFTKNGKYFFEGIDKLLVTKLYKSNHVFFKFTEINGVGVRHYHRPLEFYFHIFLNLGYKLEHFEEIFGINKKNEIPFAILISFQKKIIKYD